MKIKEKNLGIELVFSWVSVCLLVFLLCSRGMRFNGGNLLVGVSIMQWFRMKVMVISWFFLVCTL